MAQDVAEVINRDSIQTIITFDKGGISGHPNHININDAIPMIHTLCPHVAIYVLKTKGFIRKYVHAVDCIFSFFERDDEKSVVTVLESNAMAAKAMTLYPSQLVWYRYIYLMFSTYTKFNQLIELY